MKGVRRDVVEVREPEDENIERVLVFFKPDCPAVRLGTQEETACRYVQKLVTWRRGRPGRWLWAAGTILLAAAGLALVHGLL